MTNSREQSPDNSSDLIFSTRLIDIIGKQTLRQFRGQIELASLAQRFFQVENIGCPAWLKCEDLPSIIVAHLLKHLHEIARHDSRVQDISTTGHLGKLLIRWDIWVKTKNYELLGFPNSKLDALSKRDRIEFFDQKVSLNRLTDPESLEVATMLREREKQWLV